MERNERTTIGQLAIGDRFYKASDKKKEVWTKVEGDVKKTHFQTYDHFAKRDGDKYNQPFKKETQVVFLRQS